MRSSIQKKPGSSSPRPRLPSSRSCPPGVRLGPDRNTGPRRAGTSGNPGRAKPEFRVSASELSTLWARNPDFWARNPDFLGPESRKSGSGFRERNPGPPARADRKPRFGRPDSRSARAVNPGWPAPQSPGARIGKPEQKTDSEGRGFGPGSLLRPRSLLPRVLPRQKKKEINPTHVAASTSPTPSRSCTPNGNLRRRSKLRPHASSRVGAGDGGECTWRRVAASRHTAPGSKPLHGTELMPADSESTWRPHGQRCQADHRR